MTRGARQWISRGNPLGQRAKLMQVPYASNESGAL